MDRTALAVVSAGGVLGALTRWAISITWPGTVWTTWAINVSGCFLIGVLYTRVERRIPRLLLGTGFLGGYTTFSTAMVEAAVEGGVSVAGLAYLAATLVGCLLAVLAGSLVARR